MYKYDTKRMTISMCKHEIVLEIYKDNTHSEVSHYRCIGCGKTDKDEFGVKIIKKDV